MLNIINLAIFKRWRLIMLVLTPLCLIPIPVLWETLAGRCMYVLLLMGICWLFELLPIPVTALIPVILFPPFGIMSTSAVSMYYMKSSCMLFVGGLMVAIAIEHSGLHKRIGLRVLLLVGNSPRLVLLGFMLPTAFLSMWISNTASTAMMIPILEAVLTELGKEYRNMMLLSIAYAANIGGTGTLIGTPPNLVMYEFISKLSGQPVTFGSWMLFCVPLMVLNLVISWLYLQVLFLPIPYLSKQWRDKRKQVHDIEKTINENRARTDVKTMLELHYKELGPMNKHEFSVLFLFIVLVILWLTRSPGFVSGWGDVMPGKVGDATPAILVALVMFVWPTGDGATLLTWKLVQEKLAWGVIILLGGGFALAEGATRACLTDWAGQQLSKLEGFHPQILRLIFCFLVCIVTQIASNAATASMLLPVLLQLSQQLLINPLYLMLPATLTASMAFALPVSTAPNAIVFAASGMKSSEMMKPGFGITILTTLITIAWSASVGIPIFSLDTYPDWAPSFNESMSDSGAQCVY